MLQSLVLTFSQAARSHSWQAGFRFDHWIGVAAWLLLTIYLHHQAAYLLPDRDPYLLPAASLLSGWGLVTVWRLSANFGLRQTAWLVVAVVVFSIGLRLPHLLTWLRRYKYIWLTGGLLLLAGTFVIGTFPGEGITGPRLWLGCCGLYLQPSEPLKLLLVVYLASFLAGHTGGELNLVRLVAPGLVLTGLAVLLLVAQRDLGTALLFLLLFASIVYAATGKRRVIAVSVGVMVAAIAGGYYFFDVVRLRLDAWINPWLDPSGRSYQIVQSLIAAASGGVLGKGLGLGSPGVVPVAQSDFIFAAIIEESGLVGATGLLAVVGLLTIRGLRAALRAPDTFQRSLAAGLTAFLAAQSILIIGGNLRLLPLTGVTLPFVSYGGSSLVTSFVCLLLILITSSQSEMEAAPLPHKSPYLLLGAGFLTGLVACAVLAGWWTVVRAPGLNGRSDNPRLAINDRYTPRGAILDRNGLILNQTQGVTGSYSRVYQAGSTALVTGYTSPIFGRMGLEDSYDDYLRGLAGNRPIDLFRYGLLYGQPPAGRNIRTSLDLNLQNLASSLLEGEKGAAVLMNAQTGEILVMASQPAFNPTTLAEDWPTLQTNPDGPLVNRPTQGLYPAGTGMAPFILAEAANLAPPGEDATLADSGTLAGNCLGPVPTATTLAAAISAGCQASVKSLVALASTVDSHSLLVRLGIMNTPDVPLASAAGLETYNGGKPEDMLGLESPLVTPLQMALAATSLSNNGVRPPPRLVMAFNDSSQGWVLFEQTSSGDDVYPERAANATAQALAGDNSTSWSVLGKGLRSNEPAVTWYLAGTLPGWQGSRLSLVVLLESENPALAAEIGEKILFAAQVR